MVQDGEDLIKPITNDDIEKFRLNFSRCTSSDVASLGHFRLSRLITGRDVSVFRTIPRKLQSCIQSYVLSSFSSLAHVTVLCGLNNNGFELCCAYFSS